jgi:hypothetical protein
MGAPQGQGPTGFPVGQPGFLGPAPAPQTPVINPALAPLESAASEIDPLALSGKVQIKVNASDRMRTRDNLRQSAPFIAQFLMNGPFLQELAQSNMAADFPEFFRLVMDATGLQNDYRLVRPQTPEEAQKRSQPSPDAQLKAQQAQQDQQTRMQLMQTKVQGEQTVAEINAAVKNKQISEESARHLMALLQKEEADNANKPDPREKLVELQAKAAEHGMNLQHQQQKHALDTQNQQQKHQMELAHGIQAHQLEMMKAHQQNQSDARSAHTKLVFDAMSNAQKLKQSSELHKKKLAEKPRPASNAKK